MEMVRAAERIPATQALQRRGAPTPEIGCALAARLAASAFGVNLADVSAGTKVSVRATSARQIGIYLAHTALGFPLKTVADHFGRDRTTAAHACRQIEERREDRLFDAEIAELENLLRAMFGAPRGVA